MSTDELNGLTRDERAIYAKLSRRGFIGVTAAATLASLVGYEPEQLHAAGPATAMRNSARGLSG